jgi:hypothetical protein
MRPAYHCQSEGQHGATTGDGVTTRPAHQCHSDDRRGIASIAGVDTGGIMLAKQPKATRPKQRKSDGKPETTGR